MQVGYEQAKRLESMLIRFKNKEGNWAVGKVVNVKQNGLEIEELVTGGSNDSYGYGFWGRPFFGPPRFFAFGGFCFSPFFFW